MDKDITLKDLNKKYWQYNDDLMVYDIEDFFKGIINPANLPTEMHRILYYSFDFSKII